MIVRFMAFSWNFLPKSLLVVLIDVLIYVFPTHFDRGLKVRLFCSPQCLGWVKSLELYAPPNEDFGRPNKHFRTRVRSTFQRFVAQNLYSHPWKELRTGVLKWLFGLPKSSFGRSKLAHRVFKHLSNVAPCGKQHLQDLPTSDWASPSTKITY